MRPWRAECQVERRTFDSLVATLDEALQAPEGVFVDLKARGNAKPYIIG